MGTAARNNTGQLFGTSVAAASITAMAADLMGNFIVFERFPEIIRVILMASAAKPTSWGDPIWSTGGADLRAGAGVPDGAAAFLIASNGLPDALPGVPTSENSDGPVYFKFQCPATTPIIPEITKTITPTASNSAVDIWCTWIQYPAGIGAGYNANVNLTVTMGTASPKVSASAYNTTEHVVTPITGGLPYTITLTLADARRSGGLPTPIFGACAIR